MESYFTEVGIILRVLLVPLYHSILEAIQREEFSVPKCCLGSCFVPSRAIPWLRPVTGNTFHRFLR